MIRTCTDVPAGILADTSAIAIAVARIIRNDIASFCPKYSVITRPNFWRFWTFSTLMLDGDFQHRHVSEGHVQERHTKPLLALRWSDESAHGNVFVPSCTNPADDRYCAGAPYHLSGTIGAGFYAEKILICGFRIKCSSPMSVDHGVLCGVRRRQPLLRHPIWI